MGQTTLQEQFIGLLAAQQKLIHSICSLYYSSLEDRKDLFQEIILQLWKSYPSFNNQSKISTWIYRVALNTVFSRIRREKARPETVPVSEKFWHIPQPEEQTALNEATQELYQAISQLSDIDKAIIMLYLDEHPYEEIANLLEMSKTNVSTRISRIKMKLEKLLKPHVQ